VAENQLLAFDATQHGKFVPGDGKVGRYQEAGFTKAEDYLAWPIRLNEAGTFEASVRYTCAKPSVLVLRAGDQSVSAAADAVDPKSNQLRKLGKLMIPAGEHDLRIMPEKLGELSVFEVVLKPAQ
jgi:hypothetical protein